MTDGRWLALGSVAALAAAGLVRRGTRNDRHVHRPLLADELGALDFQVCRCGAVRYPKDRWVVGQPFPGWEPWEVPKAGRVRLDPQTLRGSRSTPLTITRCGFPWPTDYPMWHATTALRAIRSQGFRTRSTGAKAATGGGPSNAVSLTLDPRVADGILVGLRTLRLGARGTMGLVDLWEAAERECPQAAADLRAKEDPDRHYPSHELLDRGLLHERAEGFGRPLPQGAIPVGQGWMGRDDRLYHAWWRKPASRQERQEVKRRRRDAFYSLYNGLCAYGSSRKECYWPLFTGTDMDALAKARDEDLGVVQVTVDIDRICLDHVGAWQLCYLGQVAANSWASWLHDKHYLCSQSIQSRSDDSYYRDRSLFDGYGYPTDKMIGPFTLQDGEVATPATAMDYLPSMMEIRVYDPSRISVMGSASLWPRLRQRGLEDRLFHPWFDEGRLPSHMVEPGTIVLESAGVRVR